MIAVLNVESMINIHSTGITGASRGAGSILRLRKRRRRSPSHHNIAGQQTIYLSYVALGLALKNSLRCSLITSNDI